MHGGSEGIIANIQRCQVAVLWRVGGSKSKNAGLTRGSLGMSEYSANASSKCPHAHVNAK